MSNGTNIPQNAEELGQYEEGWAKLMIDMWHEQLAKVRAIDTGNLYGSIHATTVPGEEAVITHTFALYGIYVEAGTGHGFKRGNGGDLPFLGYEYREEHDLNRPRKVGPAWGGRVAGGKPLIPRPWYENKYWYSRMRLNEMLQEYYGNKSTNIITVTLNHLFNKQ